MLSHVTFLFLFWMIRVHDLLTPLEDNDLDEAVTQILQHHPNSGYKMMVGYLNAQGVRIQSKCLVVITHLFVLGFEYTLSVLCFVHRTTCSGIHEARGSSWIVAAHPSAEPTKAQEVLCPSTKQFMAY